MNFNGFRLLAALLHGTLVVGINQTLRCWTEGATYIRRAAMTLVLAHILVKHKTRITKVVLQVTVPYLPGGQPAKQVSQYWGSNEVQPRTHPSVMKEQEPLRFDSDILQDALNCKV